MILKSLYLKNYRTYRGPESINFANGEKNVTIVQGNNEVGKTTIMNAIAWCLYGVEYYKDDGNEPIWSKSTSYDLSNGEKDIVEVKLTMIDSKKKEVKFIRTLEFYKNDLGDCKKGSSEFDILIGDDFVTRKETFIAKHLPKNFREYFLFDGERLEQYFTKDTSKNIKTSVYKLSHLNLLTRIKNHLKNREKDFIDDLKDLNPSLAKYLNDERDLLDELENKQKKLDDVVNNLKKWKEDKKVKENTIKKFGEDAEALIDEKHRLEKEIEELDQLIDDSKVDYILYLTNNSTKIFSINYLLDVKEICKDLEEKGYIPAKYKKEFIKYLLDTHECICGADLDEGSESYNKMQELYEKTSETTDIADEVNVLLGSVNSIINNFPSDFKRSLKSKCSIIEKYESRRKEASLDLTNIGNLFSEDDEKEIKDLQETISTLEHLIELNSTNKGKLEQKIENLEEELEEVRKNIKEEESKSDEKTDLESSRDFCKLVYGKVDKIYKELEDEIHSELQELTSEEFGKMHWKEFYRGVSIDKNYNVTIHKENSDVVPNDLSKGGQLVLALSFMTALNSLSGFELPIIIDTPLGRLDEPIKRKIAENLPIYTRNKQVTLLVTSSEYSEGFKDGIKEYVGKEYTLNYIQEKDGITTIEEN